MVCFVKFEVGCDVKNIETVLSPVLKRMETEILEFLLSHQYNNKMY